MACRPPALIFDETSATIRPGRERGINCLDDFATIKTRLKHAKQREDNVVEVLSDVQEGPVFASWRREVDFCPFCRCLRKRNRVILANGEPTLVLPPSLPLLNLVTIIVCGSFNFPQISISMKNPLIGGKEERLDRNWPMNETLFDQSIRSRLVE